MNNEELINQNFVLNLFNLSIADLSDIKKAIYRLQSRFAVQLPNHIQM